MTTVPPRPDRTRPGQPAQPGQPPPAEQPPAEPELPDQPERDDDPENPLNRPDPEPSEQVIEATATVKPAEQG